MWVRLILFMGLLFPLGVKGNERVDTKIQALDDGFLYLTFLNSGGQSIHLKHNLCMSTIGHLRFKITDTDGKEYKPKGYLNEDCDLDYYPVIRPFHIAGKVFSLELIKLYHGLHEGAYYVSVSVCPVETECSHSNEVLMRVK